MEERLIELETRVAFQEKLIEELSDVLAKQQHQIDQMEQQLITVASQLGPTYSASPDSE